MLVQVLGGVIISGGLARAILVEAVQEGLAKGVRKFERWTCGEPLSWYGAENVLSVYVAEAIGKCIVDAGTSHLITMEQNFRDIVAFSKRQHPGRPHTKFAALRDHETKRVDIVLWNRSAEPKGIIEIKRNAAVGGLLADADRVVDFIGFCGREFGGTIGFGLVACVVEAPDACHLDRMVEHRQSAMKEQLSGAGVNLRMHRSKAITRRNINGRHSKSDRHVVSLVFELAAKNARREG